ncbi:MAG: sulfurtransferase [Candidatus Schekmanbacteria bacterium]|nr:MAG: sulfurtransferase [Candidatus Schekmanbacteria bacterium]
MEKKTVLELIEEAKKDVDAVTAESLNESISKNNTPIILDVREKEELDSGKIKNSLHIPRGMLEFLIETKVPDKEREIVVYCAKGPRSALAGKTLKLLGYKNVSFLAGGFDEWCKRNLEVEK